MVVGELSLETDLVVLWEHLHQLLIVRDGLIGTIHVEKHVGQITAGSDMAGIQGHSLLIGLHGLFRLALALIDVAQVIMGLDIG